MKRLTRHRLCRTKGAKMSRSPVLNCCCGINYLVVVWNIFSPAVLTLFWKSVTGSASVVQRILTKRAPGLESLHRGIRKSRKHESVPATVEDPGAVRPCRGASRTSQPRGAWVNGHCHVLLSRRCSFSCICEHDKCSRSVWFELLCDVMRGKTTLSPTIRVLLIC